MITNIVVTVMMLLLLQNRGRGKEGEIWREGRREGEKAGEEKGERRERDKVRYTDRDTKIEIKTDRHREVGREPPILPIPTQGYLLLTLPHPLPLPPLTPLKERTGAACLPSSTQHSFSSKNAHNSLLLCFSFNLRFFPSYPSHKRRGQNESTTTATRYQAHFAKIRQTKRSRLKQGF